MISILKTLCEISGVSGREDAVRDYIYNEIKDHADCRIDALGNLIAIKKGKNSAQVKLMLDAHMDEVGVIVTNINDDGTLRFHTVGGIDSSVMLSSRVRFDNGLFGVVSAKPVHLLSNDEKKKMPKIDDMTIDIGAKNKEEAICNIKPGDTAVFDSAFSLFGTGLIKSKAIDDRAGCAILVSLIKEEAEYDMTFTFTVQEEVGLRGARTAAFSVSPDSAIVIDSTTAADIAGVDKDKQVCRLGQGPVVSFMDGGTLYDKTYFDAAFRAAEEIDVKCQPKTVVAGANNSGSIHVAGKGIKTLAVSVPCRYLHSQSGVASISDIEAAKALVKEMANRITSGSLKKDAAH